MWHALCTLEHSAGPLKVCSRQALERRSSRDAGKALIILRSPQNLTLRFLKITSTESSSMIGAVKALQCSVARWYVSPCRVALVWCFSPQFQISRLIKTKVLFCLLEADLLLLLCHAGGGAGTGAIIESDPGVASARQGQPANPDSGGAMTTSLGESMRMQGETQLPNSTAQASVIPRYFGPLV